MGRIQMQLKIGCVKNAVQGAAWVPIACASKAGAGYFIQAVSG
jgi:hypothetical protein